MGSVTGLTAERMQEIIDKTIVDVDIVAQHLILSLEDGSTIDAGAVGPAGKGGAFPAGSSDGDLFVRTDLPGDPLYKYTDGAWVLFTAGISKGAAFPTVPAPTDGDMFVRTDLPGDPLYKYTDGAWELQPRMGSQAVPYCQLTYGGANQVNPAALTFDGELADTDGMHDNVTNPTRITIKTPGVYMFTCNVYNGGIRPQIGFRLNGTTFLGGTNSTGQPGETEAVLVRRMVAGDYMEVVPTTGGQTFDTLANRAPTFQAVWLGGAGQTVDERGLPAVRATRQTSGAQSVPNGGSAAIALPTEDYDTDSMHDTVSNTTRITIKTPGLYRFIGYGGFDSTATGWLWFTVNGTTSDPPTMSHLEGEDRGMVAQELLLAAGDYVELNYQNASGSARTIVRASVQASFVGSGKTVTPYSRVGKSAVQSTAASAWNSLSFNTEDADNDAIHDTVTNNTRLTARTAGIYSITANVVFAANSSGTGRFVRLLKNGSIMDLDGAAFSGAGVPARLSLNTVLELAVGDYVEVQEWHDASAAVDITTETHFMMVKIGAPNTGSLGGAAQADVFTVATLPAATGFPNGKIVGVSDAAAGQQARMAMNGAWINLG